MEPKIITPINVKNIPRRVILFSLNLKIPLKPKKQNRSADNLKYNNHFSFL